MAEAQLIIDTGPRAGTVFCVPEGTVRVFGSHSEVDFVLPDLEANHLAVRFFGAFEVQTPTEGSHDLSTQSWQTHRTGGGQRTGVTGRWEQLASGKTLQLGPYALRLELHGLSVFRAFVAQGTRPLRPKGNPEGYTIEGRVGSGSYGSVYAARRVADGQLVALKVLNREPKPRLLKRFRREFDACGSLDHPNIVRVIEQGVDRYPPYVAMELVKGPSARDLLSAGPLPMERALRLSLGLAEALATLAERRLVHRDVKPSNLLVAPGDIAKLADFGLVKDLEDTYSSITRTGFGVGTLVYSAPEQILDAKRVSTLADAYSLGATLFELVANQLPFLLRTPQEYKRVLVEPPPFLRSIRPECPASVEALTHALLSKIPEDRPSARDAVAVLRAAFDG